MSKVVTRIHYSQDLHTVIKTFCDPGFLQQKYDSLGHKKVELTVREDEDATILECKREVPIDVPRFARKVLSPKNDVFQLERWTGPDGGPLKNVWSLDVKGAPIKISGTAILRVEGDGCVHEIDGQVHCSIPLIGRKIAGFVAGDAVKGIEDEGAFAKRYLSA